MDDIQGLRMLGNLLALPNTMNAEAAEAEKMRSLLGSATQGAGGPPLLSGEQINAMAPQRSQFPGTNVPVLGTALRGLGTIGQVIQTVTGAPAAPRGGTIKSLDAFLSMQRNAGFDAARQHLAGDMRTGADRPSMAAHAVEANAPAEALRFYDKGNAPTGPRTPFGLYQEDPEAFAAWQAANAKAPASGAAKSEFELSQSDPAAYDAYMKHKQQLMTEGAQTRAQNLQDIKQLALTNSTRTMVEAAPKVKYLADKVDAALAKVEAGPFASRYNEIVSGKIGEPDPDWIHYRSNAKLLASLLMRMHVGARGSDAQLKYFGDLISSGTQSPENMRAVLDDVRDYAATVASQGTGTKPPPNADANGNTPVATIPGPPDKSVVQGTTLAEMADALAGAVNSGEITADQARTKLKAAQDAGLR